MTPKHCRDDNFIAFELVYQQIVSAQMALPVSGPYSQKSDLGIFQVVLFDMQAFPTPS